MLWSVGNRFKFSDDSLARMSLSRLRFWYRGHVFCNNEEQEAQAKLLGAIGGR
jgi:hypothetical protein